MKQWFLFLILASSWALAHEVQVNTTVTVDDSQDNAAEESGRLYYCDVVVGRFPEDYCPEVYFRNSTPYVYYAVPVKAASKHRAALKMRAKYEDNWFSPNHDCHIRHHVTDVSCEL